jgi:holin-like protein
MTLLNGLIIVLVYQLAGEVSVLYLDLPVPGPVVGMILLFISLVLRGSSSEPLEQTARSLLSHLSLLFVPAGVGVIVHFDRIVSEWIPISIAMVLSTLITLALSALIMQGFSRLFGRESGE